MTSPRINENNSDVSTLVEAGTQPIQHPLQARESATDSGGAADSDGGEPSLLASARETLGQVTGEMNDTMSRVKDAAKEEVQSMRRTWDAVVTNAKTLVDDPGDRVRNLEDGDTVVVDGGFEVSVHDGVGGSVSQAASCSVQRQGDDYIATYEGKGVLGLGIGAEAMNKGLKLDGTTGASGRIVVRAEGPEGREALADILDNPLEGDFEARIEAADNLQFERIDVLAGGGVQTATGVGLEAEVATNIRHVESVVRDENGELEHTLGVEFDHTLGVHTPSVETDPEAAAELIGTNIEMQLAAAGAPVEIPRDVIEDAIRANGGVIGLEVSVGVSGRVEVMGTDGARAQLVAEARIGGRTYAVEGEAELDTGLDIGEVEDAIQSGNLQDVAGPSVDWKLQTRTTDFVGWQLRNTGFAEFRNGVEKNEVTPLASGGFGPTQSISAHELGNGQVAMK